MPVSLRLPDDVKQRIEHLAAERETTPHAFMLEAIQEKVIAEELRSAFHAQAERRLARMKRSGRGVPAGEVFKWLERRARGEQLARPKPRRIG